MTLPQFFAAMYDLILQKLKEQALSYITIVLVATHLYYEQGKYKDKNDKLLDEVRKCEISNAELRTQIEALQAWHIEADTPKTEIKPKKKRTTK